MMHPWAAGAAGLTPAYRESSETQASRSVYRQQAYTAMPSATPPGPSVDAEQAAREARAERHIAYLISYILTSMEPSDRCLRPVGDVWTVEREREPREAWNRKTCAARGTEPWDGVSDPEPVGPAVAEEQP